MKLALFGKYALDKVSSLIDLKICSEIVFPVDFLTNKLAPLDMPDCIIEAVLNPDDTGPINASGAIKHPDVSKPITVINISFFNIESPLNKLVY